MARPRRDGTAQPATTSRRDSARRTGDYADLSTRPLHVLVFLLPLIVAYQLGSALFLSVDESTVQLISAQAVLVRFFEAFGLGGLYLPGIVLVVILLIWHVMVRDPWRVRWRVLGLMLLESLGWMLPLMVLGQIVYRVMSGAPPLAQADVTGLSLPGRAAISIGAGLYEEMLFRLVAIALVHLIAADVLGMRELWAWMLAVGVSALLFALYHDVATHSGGIDLASASVFFSAGLYFGALYATRGFGIVVATHALYDLAVLVLLPSATGSTG